MKHGPEVPRFLNSLLESTFSKAGTCMELDVEYGLRGCRPSGKENNQIFTK
jgi:hypothetical protein